ncbi:hypothetical protein J3E64_002533 [Sphingobium sp. OAS761]|uniref:GNAT family N-acetyltransferase n=1 Tax=Sphingobium sp. OAS761 TaxID=2817901 RepID=UPI00209D99BC|nr:GNAT family N-acetyltransferase [Sphingobium sp. OAS761]MCP1470840.1 hypothetical protein [Sphingobium sp. OAS761]
MEYQSLADVRDVLHGRLDRAVAPGLFSRIDWFEMLHRHCLSDHPPHVLRARDGEDEAWLFLAAPATGQMKAMANWYSFEWGPVFLGDGDGATRQALLDALARRLLETQARIDLYPLEASAPLLASLRRAGWIGVSRAMGGRYLLDVQGRSFAEYWAARPGRLRSLVRRKGRASPFALSVEDRLTDALWDDYVAVHARSWKAPEPGLELLRALAERESRAGALRLGFARIDGLPVATQLWTVDRGVALIHKLSHDRALDHLSPGTLLSHHMFACAIDGDRVGRIDYGTGDNDYKTDWMERRIPLLRIDAFHPRYASNWLPAARTAISALVG